MVLDKQTFTVIHTLIEACKQAQSEIEEILDCVVPSFSGVEERPRMSVEKSLLKAIKQGSEFMDTASFE